MRPSDYEESDQWRPSPADNLNRSNLPRLVRLVESLLFDLERDFAPTKTQATGVWVDKVRTAIDRINNGDHV